MLSGSNPRKFCLSLLPTVVLSAFVVACFAANPPAEQPAVVKLLPAANAVKGWEVYPDTLAYAAGENLTEIYNGGYEVYTKNGVLDAATQLYRKGDDIAGVTVHRMESPKSAAKFLEYWMKDDKKQRTFKLLKTPTKAYTYILNGTASGRLYRSQYFVTVEVNINGEKGRALAGEFLKSIAAKIGKAK